MKNKGSVPAINHIQRQLTTAYWKRDTTALASLYTDDGMIWPPGSEPVKGKELIRDFWQSMMDIGIADIKMEVLETDSIQHTIIEMSRFLLLGSDLSKLDHGNRLMIWKQTESGWKLSKDIFCSNQPVQ